MHIVSKRTDLTLDEALQAPDGLAMLGVFIEVKPGEVKLLTVVYMLYWLSNTFHVFQRKLNLHYTRISEGIYNVNRAEENK